MSAAGAGDVVGVPVWRGGDGRVKVIGRGVTGMQMAGDDGALLPEFEGCMAALDAPELLVCGSTLRFLSLGGSVHEVFAAPSRAWRAGCFA